MQARVIPSATKDTLIVPKLRKGIDSKLVFKRIHNPMCFEVEIIYADKSLGTYHTTNFNEIILIFFQKLSKINNGAIEGVQEKLDNLEKKYHIDKKFIDQQLSNAEYIENEELLKEQINQNFTSYPLEYNNEQVKDIIGLTEKQNIIKFTCDKYDLRLKDLADAIGMKETSLRAFASNNKISKQVETAIELYAENIELKKEIEILKSDKNT